jgi:hypothetical protein
VLRRWINDDHLSISHDRVDRWITNPDVCDLGVPAQQNRLISAALQHHDTRRASGIHLIQPQKHNRSRAWTLALREEPGIQVTASDLV